MPKGVYKREIVRNSKFMKEIFREFNKPPDPVIDPNATIWNPQRGSQYSFFQCPVFELLYGGAAGGGKSEALIIEAARDVMKPDYKAILFRRTFPELEKSLVPRCYEMFSGLGGSASNKGMDWRFPSGARIYLSHLQRPEDKEKHKSAEYDFIGFDELTSFTEDQYIYLFSRCRGKNPEIKRRVRSASNPTGIGNGWVRKRFVDVRPDEQTRFYGTVDYERAIGWKLGSSVYNTFESLPEGYEKGSAVFSKEEYPVWEDIKSGITRAYIPSLIWNNEILIKNDPLYVKRLLSLPEKQRKGLLYGMWDIFEGQFFSEWDEPTHVVDSFEIPAEWKRYVGIDYGFASPFCAIWFAVDLSGNVYAYRELYGTKMHPSEQAQRIIELSTKENIQWFAADPSMWAERGLGESFAQVFDREGLTLFPSNNSRPAGWALMHEFLCTNKLKIFRNCVNGIRTIPTLNHSRRNPDDLDTMQEDHWVDACRYFLLTLRGFKSPTKTSEGVEVPSWWAQVKTKKTSFIANGKFSTL